MAREGEGRAGRAHRSVLIPCNDDLSLVLSFKGVHVWYIPVSSSIARTIFATGLFLGFTSGRSLNSSGHLVRSLSPSPTVPVSMILLLLAHAYSP
jgi:hypothetical protein